MKIRFTITLSALTLEGFKEQGCETAEEIISELKSALQDRLDDANQTAPSPSEDDDEEAGL